MVQYQQQKTTEALYKKIQNYCYRYCDVLGQGNFSTVYKAINQSTGENVAIKVIELASIKSSKLEELLTSQIEIIKKLKHPNIVRCYQVLNSINNCYIVTQLCQCDLQSKIKQKTYEQSELYSIIKDIYEGLVYLSSQNIVHRDIKLSNIFMSNGGCKIADFGFAKVVKDSFKDVSIGSPLYMSPQGFVHNMYGPKTDVWSFGILLYELTHGHTPHHFCKNENQLTNQLLKPFNESNFKKNISNSFKELILKCLIIKQNERINIEDIKKLDFMKKVYLLSNKRKPRILQSNNSMYGFSMSGISAVDSNHKIAVTPDAKRKYQYYSKPKSQLKQQYKFVTKKQTKNIENQKQKQQSQNLVVGSKSPSKSNIKTVVDKEWQERFYKRLREKSQSKQKMQENRSINFQQIPLKSIQYKIDKKQNRKSFENKESYQFLSKQKNGSNLLKPFLTQQYNRQPIQPRKESLILSKKGILLPRKLNFNQALGLLHYCRFCFKYIGLIKQMATINDKSTNRVEEWILSILNELMKKNQNKCIIYEATKANKQNKFKEVLKEYINKYSDVFKKNKLSKINSGQSVHSNEIIEVFLNKYKQIDELLTHNYADNYLVGAYYSLILFDWSNKIKKSQQLRQFALFGQCEIEQIINKKKDQINMELYLSTRRTIKC